MHVVLWDTFRDNSTNPYLKLDTPRNSKIRSIKKRVKAAFRLPNSASRTRKPCSILYPILFNKFQTGAVANSDLEVSYRVDNAPPADAYVFVPQLDNFSVTVGMMCELRNARPDVQIASVGPMSHHLKSLARQIDVKILGENVTGAEFHSNTTFRDILQSQNLGQPKLEPKKRMILSHQDHRCSRRFRKFPTVKIHFDPRAANSTESWLKQTESALENGARSIIFENYQLFEKRELAREFNHEIGSKAHAIEFAISLDRTSIQNVDVNRLIRIGLAHVNVHVHVNGSNIQELDLCGHQLEKELITKCRNADVQVNLNLRISAECSAEKVSDAFRLAAELDSHFATVQQIPTTGVNIVDRLSARQFENLVTPKLFHVHEIDRNCRIFQQLGKSELDRAA